MTRCISIDPVSMLGAAAEAGKLCGRIAVLGGRIGSLPTPEGAEDLMGSVHAVGADVIGASGSLSSLMGWLNDRALRAILADQGDVLGASAPLQPGKPWGGTSDPNDSWGIDTITGIATPFYELGVGLVKSSYVLGSYTVDSFRNQWADPMGLAASAGAPPKYRDTSPWRKEFDDGIAYAKAHPTKFIGLMLGDQIALKDYQDGNKDLAVGKNIGSAATFLLSFLKVGAVAGSAAKASRAASKAGRVAQSARTVEASADAARTSAQLARGALEHQITRYPGESTASFNARKHARVVVRTAAEREIHRRDGVLETARTNREAAETAATSRAADRDAKVAARNHEASKLPDAARGLRPDTLDANSSTHSVFGNLPDQCEQQRPAAAGSRR